MQFLKHCPICHDITVVVLTRWMETNEISSVCRSCYEAKIDNQQNQAHFWQYYHENNEELASIHFILGTHQIDIFYVFQSPRVIISQFNNRDEKLLEKEMFWGAGFFRFIRS